MLTGTVTKTKMEHANESMEKAEINSDTEEVFKNVVGAQKTLIEQQKVLIDWLTGQVTGSGTTKPVPKRLKDFLMDRPTQFWLAGLLLAIIIIASLVLTFCLYNYTGGNNTPAFGHNDNLGDDIQIIQREEWLARPPLYTTPFTRTPKMVRILHSSSPNCSDYQTCANKILGLQGIHVATDHLPDIAYNFMIGGDGCVYIGRGADVANEAWPDVIDIVYIGNYLSPYDRVSKKMNEAGKRLISRLLEKGKLTEDYIVVAQNQTEKTSSPGENVYKQIILWPHYDSGLYFKN